MAGLNMTWKLDENGNFPHLERDEAQWQRLNQVAQGSIRRLIRERHPELERLCGGDASKEQLLGSIIIDVAETAVVRAAMGDLLLSLHG